MKKFIFPILLIFLVSCNPWKFVGEYDKEADFSKFKTFGLLNWEKQNDKQVNSETKEFILLAIKKQLEARGYTYQKDDADLQVSVYIIVSEATSYSAYTNQYQGYGGYGSVSVGVGVGSGGASVGAYGYGINPYPYTVVKHDYNAGTFVIDLLDHSQKKIIWQGVASGRVAHEEGNQASVNDKVARLFETLPVKKVKKKNR